MVPEQWVKNVLFWLILLHSLLFPAHVLVNGLLHLMNNMSRKTEEDPRSWNSWELTVVAENWISRLCCSWVDTEVNQVNTE